MQGRAANSAWDPRQYSRLTACETRLLPLLIEVINHCGVSQLPRAPEMVCPGGCILGVLCGAAITSVQDPWAMVEEGWRADCLYQPARRPSAARPPPARRCEHHPSNPSTTPCRRCRKTEDMDGYESQGSQRCRSQGGTRHAAASRSERRQRSLRHGGFADGSTFQWLQAWDSALHGAAASDAAAAAAIAAAAAAAAGNHLPQRGCERDIAGV